jgi:hypothetical protein
MRRLQAALAVVAIASSGAALALSTADGQTSCSYPETVQALSFSASRYPNLHQHYLDAIAKGWPQIVVLDRQGEAARRSKLLAPMPTRPGLDRDEYPPTSLREGWLADVEYVPSSENRSQGASLGHQLAGLCNGVRVQYRWER